MGYPSMRYIPFEYVFDKTKPVMHAFNQERSIENLEEFALRDGYQSSPFTDLPNEGKLAEQLEILE